MKDRTKAIITIVILIASLVVPTIIACIRANSYTALVVELIMLTAFWLLYETRLKEVD